MKNPVRYDQTDAPVVAFRQETLQLSPPTYINPPATVGEESTALLVELFQSGPFPSTGADTGTVPVWLRAPRNMGQSPPDWSLVPAPIDGLGPFEQHIATGPAAWSGFETNSITEKLDAMTSRNNNARARSGSRHRPRLVLRILHALGSGARGPNPWSRLGTGLIAGSSPFSINHVWNKRGDVFEQA
jgi:hypothetical protein